jgi:hypothetical protein
MAKALFSDPLPCAALRAGRVGVGASPTGELALERQQLHEIRRLQNQHIGLQSLKHGKHRND